MEYILKKVAVDLGWIFWRENLRRNKYLKRKNSMQGKLFTMEKILGVNNLVKNNYSRG